MKRPKTRNRRSEEEIRRLLDDYHASGTSQLAFCRSKGIHPSLLARWLRREREKAKVATGGLVPVRIVPEGKNGSVECSAEVGAMELILSGGRRVVRVPKDFDAQALSRLLSVLEAGC